MPIRSHISGCLVFRPSRGLAVAMCAVLLATTGCAGLRPFWHRQQVACVLPPNPSVDDIVAHVNANVDKVQGYRATSLKIRANNMPLQGNLVVERDRRLRLEVNSLAGKEVDLGSNDEVFWIWARRNEVPGVYYASHEDMDVARQNLPMPFEPEWLMEALGVAPLSAENVHLEGEPGNGAIRLVSQHQFPNGQQVRKVVVVNSCTGCVIEHSTYTAQGQPLVRVLLQDYKLDPATGAMLPRHIKLDWPQAEMSLAMSLGNVEVNPPPMPAVWEMPQVPGAPLVDLGVPRDHLGRPRNPIVQATPGRTRINDAVSPVAGPNRPLMFASSAPEFRAPDAVGPSGRHPGFLDEPQFYEPTLPEPTLEPSISTAIAPF